MAHAARHGALNSKIRRIAATAEHNQTTAANCHPSARARDTKYLYSNDGNGSQGDDVLNH